jgi:hypothetical protein
LMENFLGTISDSPCQRRCMRRFESIAGRMVTILKPLISAQLAFQGDRGRMRRVLQRKFEHHAQAGFNIHAAIPGPAHSPIRVMVERNCNMLSPDEPPACRGDISTRRFGRSSCRASGHNPLRCAWKPIDRACAQTRYSPGITPHHRNTVNEELS